MKQEFWESAFSDKKEMWGFEPAQSAVIAKDLFVQHGVKNVLIPGIGYGRNAQVFIDAGMAVTGVETSQTAINMAAKHYGDTMTIYHGSVTGMPFDDKLYDGIFCYALIHLLNDSERAKLIRDCYSQLAPSGLMVFTTISKQAPTYGQGKMIGKDRYEQFGGVNMFFYDSDTIQQEFAGYGLTQVDMVVENYPLHYILCSKA